MEEFGRICRTSEGSADLYPDLVRSRLDAIHSVEIERDGTQFDHHPDANAFDHGSTVPIPRWTSRYLQRRYLWDLIECSYVDETLHVCQSVWRGIIVARGEPLNGAQ